MDMKIKEAMAELEEGDLLEAIRNVADSGEGVDEAIEAMQKGMEIVGERFESGEYFVGDLIFAGEIMNEAMDILKPLFVGDGKAKLGRVILCTVKDDLHDIGKNIVKSILEAGGFDVLDLGIDTPVSKIVDTAKMENIKIVALSGVLTLAVDSMKATVAALKEAGLDDVKVIIGGTPVTETVCGVVGADAWADSPQKTLAVCKQWASQE